MPRRITIATGTRADWGLLHPLALRLISEGAVVTVVATNSHLQQSQGYTVNEICADGFDPVRIPAEGTPAEVTAGALRGFSGYFREKSDKGERQDAVVILGDRFEMLGTATAALLEGVPIAHIAGGTISEGAFDDAIRHSITKMAWLHFPETELCRQRILRMGEDPDRVFTAGAPGVYNLLQTPLMTREELEESLGWCFPDVTVLATLHAATLNNDSPLDQMRHLIEALEHTMEIHARAGKRFGVLFTYPNNDIDPTPQIAEIESFASRHPQDVKSIPSLGRVRYLSALRCVQGVVGNSSSGLVEVPSAGIPTLDIGIRQHGRECGPSVIHCGSDTASIIKGLGTILSEEIRDLASRKENPYHRPDTPALIATEILRQPLPSYPQKKFHEYPQGDNNN